MSDAPGTSGDFLKCNSFYPKSPSKQVSPLKQHLKETCWTLILLYIEIQMWTVAQQIMNLCSENES